MTTTPLRARQVRESGRGYRPSVDTRLLLDTHIVLWWNDDDPRLGPAVRRAIAEAGAVYVSAASAWEFAVKAALGKLRMSVPFETAVRINAFLPLDVTFAHAAAVRDLAPHHGDPFDRLLVAQAQIEGLVLVTHDARLSRYGVPVLHA